MTSAFFLFPVFCFLLITYIFNFNCGTFIYRSFYFSSKLESIIRNFSFWSPWHLILPELFSPTQTKFWDPEIARQGKKLTFTNDELQDFVN